MIRTTLMAAVAGVVLVEALRAALRLQLWRKRADALERATFALPDERDEKRQEQLLISAGVNLAALALYTATLVLLVGVLLEWVPDWLDLVDGWFLFVVSASFLGYNWARGRWLQPSVTGRAPGEPVPAAAASHTPITPAYGRVARWLHWLALELQLVRRTSFDLEKFLFLNRANKQALVVDRPVYVMGLARSGTTIVLELLERCGRFRSPTYRDMPFVLCPNLWRRASQFGRLNPRLSGRAHGDGLSIHFDSPESFEEVFWRTVCESKPGPELAYEGPDGEALADFAAYRALVVLSAGEPADGKPLRYLSKNNNNVLRWTLLLEQPGATVVWVIRDPVATAQSLHRMHKRFSAMQANDVFVTAYMRWLGHHEFGQAHRPLAMGMPAGTVAGGQTHLNPDDVGYWLVYWCRVHAELLRVLGGLPAPQRERLHLVFHEDLLTDPAGTVAAVYRGCGLDELTVDEVVKLVSGGLNSTSDIPGFGDAANLMHARRLYCDLKDLNA